MLAVALARRFHNLGKKVIITARKHEEKLIELTRKLPGLEYRVWYLTDLNDLPNQVKNILVDFPNLDSVYINAGIQNHYLLFQQPPNNAEVISEITTKLTAPTLVAQSFAPHLLKLAQSGTKTNFFLTSSSLAYFPIVFYPTYCAARAGIAAFARILRMQLGYTGCKEMNVVEVVPPHVDTALNAHTRDQTQSYLILYKISEMVEVNERRIDIATHVY